MVDVTRKNFEELFPEICEKIEASTFIAVDAEYTGIYSDDLKDSNTLFDSAEERYLKVRSNVSKFTTCQYGLAIFKKVRDENVYYVECYNFYLFPVAFEAFAKRDLLVCQVSCMNFLSRHNFDFNKFMKEGIPFLNEEKAESLKSFVRTNRYFMHSAEHLDKDYFPKKSNLLSDEDVNDIVDRLAGFSKVIEALHKSGKPIVGHNFLTDLLMTYQQFWADLPQSYEEFKTSVHKLFPLVYDTKFLCREVQQVRRERDFQDSLLTDSCLYAVYANTYSVFELNMPVVEPKGETVKYHAELLAGRNKNLQTLPNSNCHNAGFDAIITGCVFLNLCYMACRPVPVPDYRKGLPPTFTELLGKTECWNNRVNVARAIIAHINLAGADPESHRPNWILVRSCDGKFIDPVKLKMDLVKYGDVEIHVTNETEVVVACGGIGCFKRVFKDLKGKGYALKEKRVVAGSVFSNNSRLKMFGVGAVTSAMLYVIFKCLK